MVLLYSVLCGVPGHPGCGRTVDVGCSSLTFPIGYKYDHICGHARRYQKGSLDAFGTSQGKSIDDDYVDGISITRGRP